jgi:sugar lactone lactonase YvrE
MGCTSPIGPIQAMATDSAGNVYVAETSSVKKITPERAISTLAGDLSGGFADGTGGEARFTALQSIATDGAGNVYVVDGQVIRKITSAGVVRTLAGQSGVAGYQDGVGSEARFFNPFGIAADDAGNVYVADTWNQVIRKITPAGVVSTVVGKAGAEGLYLTTLPATLSWPRGVAVSGGKLYITTANSVVWVYAP